MRFVLFSLGLTCVGCETQVIDLPASGSGGEAAWSTTTWGGQTAGGGFGSRIAVDAGGVLVSAPFASEVHWAPVGSTPIAIFTGEPREFLGMGLAWSEGDIPVYGVPGGSEARVVTGFESTVALRSPGVGGVLFETGGRWIASTPTGWVDSFGTVRTLGRRPDAIGRNYAGEIVAGAAFGTVALWIEDTPVPRSTEGDEAGFAIARCYVAEATGADSAGDSPGLLVGMPGIGMVATLGSDGTLGAPFGTGTGRFGAAIACLDDGSVWIGAPAEGEEHNGAVYRWKYGAGLTQVLTGEAWDELGTSIAGDSTVLFVGSPGHESSTGRVMVVDRTASDGGNAAFR